jgi:hypothetical protein
MYLDTFEQVLMQHLAKRKQELTDNCLAMDYSNTEQAIKHFCLIKGSMQELATIEDIMKNWHRHIDC